MRGLPSVSFRLLWILFAVVLVLTLTVSCATTSSSPSPTSSSSPGPSPSPTPSPTPSPHPTPTPTASGVLFFDDFSNPISDWQIFSNAQGQSMYADGFYRVEVTEPYADAYGTLQGHTFSDFMLEADLRPYDVPSQYRYGVVFRWQDPDNYYRLSLDNTGYFEVLKRVGGTLEFLADFTYSEAITQSETVRLKVICIGPVLTFYANDTRLGQYQDSSLVEGEIGMLVSAYEDAPVAVNFGPVRVSVPPEEEPNPTPTATTAGVLYQDDFSRPRPEMLVETGNSYDLGYQDGAYRIRLMESQVPVWVHIPGDWSDAVVQVDTKLQQGDEQVAYGLICRYQDEQHWYGFAISAEGSYFFFKIRGEEREDLMTGFSAAIGSGENTLSVECRGDQFVVSINGEEIDYTWDSDYYAGGVGLFVRTFDTPQATVLFDNLKVLPLP